MAQFSENAQEETWQYSFSISWALLLNLIYLDFDEGKWVDYRGVARTPANI